MENAASVNPISMEQRLDFWRMTMLRIGRVGPQAATKEIEPLVAMIESGALGDDLVREHGATLITYALAHWPSGDASHWSHAYGGDRKKAANLLAYQPGQDWDTAGAHAPLERVVAALLRVGADPWRANFREQDGFIQLANGQTYPPAWFTLREDDLPAASFQAFMAHPSCPPINDLMRHRDDKGRSLAELAAKNHPQALALFLKRGADPNMIGSKDLPLLFHAGTRESVKLLVAHGAKTDLLDSRGNSLEVHWGLAHPVMASGLISELPKRAKNAPPPKAALATLLANLDTARRYDVRSILSSMKDPTSHKWTVNGVEFDLLEAMASIAVFGPLSAKAVALEEMSNKKYAWPESSRQMLHLVRALCKTSDPGDEGKELGKVLDKKLGDPISDEAMAAVVARAIQVQDAVLPGANASQLEQKEKNRIMLAWDFLLRKATNDGKTSGPLALPMFQGMQQATLTLRNVPAYYSDKLFRCLVPFVQDNPVPDKAWKFWTSMGIASATLGEPQFYELWKGTLPAQDPEWFKDDNIHFQMQRPNRSKLRADLDELVLQRTSIEAPAPARVGPRL